MGNRAMESLEDIGFGGLKLLQSEDGFRFGIDAVLLADFACCLYPEANNIADLGTGNGAAAFIISHKNQKAFITGVDVQAKAIDLALRSRALNGLEERMEFLQCDVERLPETLREMRDSCDAVVSNPPYVAKGAGMENDDDSKFLSRHETTAGIEEFVKAAAFLLRDRGHFFLVHRPARLVDIFYYCRKHGLEPKEIRFVAPRKETKPNILLLHCVKGGGRELDFLEKLYVYGDDGKYSPEIMKIYEKNY